MSEPVVVPSNDLDDDIDRYLMQGFRTEMIMPSDAPREVLLSKGSELVLLRAKNRQRSTNAAWATGRAGMEYRDLIPGRLNGKVIASHIRLNKTGEVSDYVHYHKIDFQVIYCLKGRIKVVYEDQGPPFWMEAGDCVLQPPEIRHRVLECTAGAEVIEVTSPAEHETWVEHDITLPTRDLKPDREFGGQRFVRHIAADAAWQPCEFDGFEARDTGIGAVAGGWGEVRILRPLSDKTLPTKDTKNTKETIYIPLDNSEMLVVSLEDRR